MKTTYIGQTKFFVRQGRYYRIEETSRDAMTNIEWAEGLLARPTVTFQNGRDAHEVANEVMEACEDVLLDYLVLVA